MDIRDEQIHADRSGLRVLSDGLVLLQPNTFAWVH